MSEQRILPANAEEDTYSTEQIARDIASDQGHESWWRYYHPVVRWTIDWLADRGFLVITRIREARGE